MRPQTNQSAGQMLCTLFVQLVSGTWADIWVALLAVLLIEYRCLFMWLCRMQENLADLNSQLSSNGSSSLPMNRFRPNVVLAGIEGAAWTDDMWGSVAVGGAQLSYVKPCSRCKVTTIDQETGEEGREPLKTLGQFRCGQLSLSACFGVCHSTCRLS
jgi:hypothetical protein